MDVGKNRGCRFGRWPQVHQSLHTVASHRLFFLGISGNFCERGNNVIITFTDFSQGVRGNPPKYDTILVSGRRNKNFVESWDSGRGSIHPGGPANKAISDFR